MSSQYTDNDYNKQKNESENSEPEEQLSDFTPIEGSAWTGEKYNEASLKPEKQTVDNPTDESLPNGTPSWVAMPDEKSEEDMKHNADMDDMEEIHELDELDRLDELDEVENQYEENLDFKAEKIVTPIVAISSLTGPLTNLFNLEETETYRTRWSKIQGNFVDDPKATVQEADVFVSELIEEMKRKLAEELMGLESQWKQSPRMTTEDLRVTLQLYRSFFNRLIGK